MRLKKDFLTDLGGRERKDVFSLDTGDGDILFVVWRLLQWLACKFWQGGGKHATASLFFVN